LNADDADRGAGGLFLLPRQGCILGSGGRTEGFWDRFSAVWWNFGVMEAMPAMVIHSVLTLAMLGVLFRWVAPVLEVELSRGWFR